MYGLHSLVTEALCVPVLAGNTLKCVVEVEHLELCVELLEDIDPRVAAIETVIQGKPLSKLNLA